MLHKRDPIFWMATAIFVVSLVLAMAVDDGFLLLAVAAYLLRPTLHSLGFARRLVDERQMQIQYQASNVAFTALVIGNIVVILHLMGKGDHTWEMVNAVLLVALAVRALTGLLMVGDPAVAGPRIVIAVGLFVGLVGVMEGDLGGLFSHVVPGLIVVALGIAGRRAPRAVAVTLFVLGAAVVALVTIQGVQRHAAPRWGTVLAITLITAPMVTAAFCMLRGASLSNDDVPLAAALPGGGGSLP